MSEDKISFSEASTLAHCEQKWAFKYALKREDAGSKAMGLGSLVHKYVEDWWQGGMPLVQGTLDEVRMIERTGSSNSPELVEAVERTGDEERETARWLIERYDEHYGPWSESYIDRVRAQEQTIEVEYGPYVLKARLDALIKDEQDRLWLVERKTMRDWRRLSMLPADPQLTLYWWVARRAGYPVYGIMYDAIRTYRWKRDKRPASESFDRLWLDRTEEQAEQALVWLDTILRRRDELRNGEVPIRNLSQFACAGCPFQIECHDGMAFGNDIEIVEA